MVAYRRKHLGLRTSLVAVLAGSVSVLFALGGVASAQTTSSTSSPVHAQAVQAPPPSGNNGTTIDPLQYNCGNDAPSCGQVGESYGYYDGQNVDLLYSENYYCDPGVKSGASTGCEVGAPPSSTNPTGTSSDGTSLGNTTHSDILYIPTPLFAPTPPTQCIATATCIDHPPTVDLSRLGGPFSADTNVAIPAHDHFVTTRNSGLPEWWNVQVVPISTSAAWNTFISTGTLTAAQMSGAAASNIYLFFQVLPGQVPAAQFANQGPSTPAAPPGPAVATAPSSSTANQTESGTTFNNLVKDCGATAPNCQNIGISHDWIDGQDVQALYTEQYYCGTPADGKGSGAQSGCEAGSASSTVPPGVSDTTAPNQTASPAVTNSQIDPLYIPIPLFANSYDQCSSAIVCIDHPATIDLSRLASALGAPASALTNVALPGHDHLLTTRNGDQPEWWNVIAIPVTSQAGLPAVYNSKSYSAVKALEGQAGSGIGGEIPTNAYLWFQTLPGASAPTPGPLQTSCMSTLPSGTVTGAAALPDGTGYIETDAKGDVAVFGGAACYGSLTGVALNKPIVGIAVDRTTGGYWLAAADGGVFSFNAPFYGSMGGKPLNKPVVGIATDLNSNGYWLVASDGGVFSFNEPFYGSTGNITLNKPVVGMGLDRATGGYWLVASDGGVFSFNAPFYGSTGNMTLNKPVVGIAPVSDGSGYRLIAADGGVFDFNTPFYGSTGNMTLNKPVIAGLNNNSYDGYWLVASDGGVFTFSPPSEGMPFYGSAA